ncbi:hypothetical protein SDC9_157659 [bioreactor metagenome]|uniref:Uncharacterized protein n=1 Tax=bioreactor metagenome TaxID=1076179 RepID=A0A645FCZ7_9ZZZZ
MKQIGHFARYLSRSAGGKGRGLSPSQAVAPPVRGLDILLGQKDIHDALSRDAPGGIEHARLNRVVFGLLNAADDLAGNQNLSAGPARGIRQRAVLLHDQGDARGHHEQHAKTPPIRAIRPISKRAGASHTPSAAHMNKAGSVKIAPAATGSPAEPMV